MKCPPNVRHEFNIWGALHRAKHSLETNIKAVNDVLELGMPVGAIAKLLHTAKVVVQEWV